MFRPAYEDMVFNVFAWVKPNSSLFTTLREESKNGPTAGAKVYAAIFGRDFFQQFVLIFVPLEDTTPAEVLFEQAVERYEILGSLSWWGQAGWEVDWEQSTRDSAWVKVSNLCGRLKERPDVTPFIYNSLVYLVKVFLGR